MTRDPRPRGPAPVISEIVQQGFCCGCGVCAAVCPEQCLEMRWSEHGLRVPEERTGCLSRCGLCVGVCPFGSHGVNEDTLAQEAFGAVPGATAEDTLGHCLGAYVGHCAKGTCRADGTSGGVARWFLATLLETGRVKRVLCVLPGPDPENLFQFVEVTSPEAIYAAPRSAYYPTDLAEVLRAATGAEGPCAVVGLPCVAKGVRLAARRMPGIRDRLAFVAGMVCGQLMSRDFAECLVRSAGLAMADVTGLSFREKRPADPANRFDVVARTAEGTVTIPSTSAAYARTWATGQLKPPACDLCDDVFAETADIVFMDAWLPAYTADPRGTNIVVTRSAAAEAVIREGIERGDLDLAPIGVEDILRSQANPVRRKRHTLAQRLWMLDAQGRSYPPKRVQAVRPGWHGRLLRAAFEAVRDASHEAMRWQRGVAPVGLDEYHRLMRGPLKRLERLRACAPDRLLRVPSVLAKRARVALGARKHRGGGRP